MSVSAHTTELTSQYTAQVTADLERNIKEQERVSAEIAALSAQLTALQRDQAVLATIRRALETAPAVDSAPVTDLAPAPATKPVGVGAVPSGDDITVPAPRKRAAARAGTGGTGKRGGARKGTRTSGAAAASSAGSAKAGSASEKAVSVSATAGAGSAKAAKTPSANRKSPKSRAAEPRSAKSAAAEPRSAKSPTAEAGSAKSSATAAGSTGPAPAGTEPRRAPADARPTLVELVRRHLGEQREPRSAAEIAAALGQAHPERSAKVTVVRTTLEGLVAKTQAHRTKQGASVFYTAAARQAPVAGEETAVPGRTGDATTG